MDLWLNLKNCLYCEFKVNNKEHLELYIWFIFYVGQIESKEINVYVTTDKWSVTDELGLKGHLKSTETVNVLVQSSFCRFS